MAPFCRGSFKAGFHLRWRAALSHKTVNNPLKTRAGIQTESALRPRESGISDLPAMALGAISLPVRAAIDIVEAVRAGRQRV
jgi:hypothetical protein